MIQQAASQDIARLIGQWNVRLRLQQALIWLPRGLSAGLAVGVVVALLARYQPILLREQVLLIGLGAMAAGGLVAGAVVWVWPRPTLAYARRYDLLFGLKERLSTALELAAGRLVAVHGEIAALQLDDAVQSARRVDYRERIPLRFRWQDWAIAGMLLAAFLLLWWLPNPQAEAAAAQQAFEQAIEGQVSDLRDLREEVLSDTNLTEEEREALLQTLDETIETLEQPEITREEAVATLSEAGEKLRDLAEERDLERQMDDLREAGEAFNDEPSRELGEAMQQGDMQGAAQNMQDLANRLEALSQAQREALAEQLEQAAEVLEESNPELAELMREAAEALREGDLERAQQAMEEIAEQLQQQGQQAQQQQSAQQLMERMSEHMQQGQQQMSQLGQRQDQQSQQAQQGQMPQQGEEGQPGQQGQQQGQQGQQGQPGQEGQSQAGQLGMAEGQGEELGEGNQPGQSEILGFQEGEAQGGVNLSQPMSEQQGGRGAGEGMAGFGENAGAGGSADEPMDTDNLPGGMGVREYEPILAPSRIGGQGPDAMNLPLNPEDLEGLPWQPGRLVEPESGQSFVPYSEVFGDYANAVDGALESGRIPLGLRGVIRAYFTSLEP